MSAQEEITFISSGLSGAEIGFLNAGLELSEKGIGIVTAGYIRKGFKTDTGEHPDYARRYGLQECFDDSKRSRDLLNLENSDLLAVFIDSKMTDKHVRSLKLIHYARTRNYQAAKIEKKNEIMVFNEPSQMMPVVVFWDLNTVSVFQYLPVLTEVILKYKPKKIMVSGSTSAMDSEIEKNVRLFWVQTYLGLRSSNFRQLQTKSNLDSYHIDPQPDDELYDDEDDSDDSDY